MATTTILQRIADFCRRVFSWLSGHHARMQGDAVYRQTVFTLLEWLIAPLRGQTGQLGRVVTTPKGTL